MRTGACTVQQALTTEAASVLKHSLSLAKRRGHSQVTPLHVAATLLSSSSSSSSRDTTSLLRRACLKSHPLNPTSHPLHCRALELCFNVALNRLPTIPPPSSGTLVGLSTTHPSLSNALIAALKRAQAHQRRGCIEQQQQLQQQQPLLAIKVELEQLIISILDDPSVSRVMREAGFSSTSVKNNLEEYNPVSVSSFLFEPHQDTINQSSFWQNHFLKTPVEKSPLVFSSQKDDLRVVMEVMIKKHSRRNNIVVVGDSASSTEGLVVELMGRVERGEVPDELKSAYFIKLQLSSLHLRFMSKDDVEMKVSDLRKKIESITSERGGGGVIIYAGDLRWAVDDEVRDGEVSEGVQGYRSVEHLIAEVGRLLSELRTCNNNVGGNFNNRVWLMAIASYQTYMRCLMRHPSLETQWALQAVVVPSGGLALSLQAPSGLDSGVTKLPHSLFQMLESKSFIPKQEQDKLICCTECTSNFQKEASLFKSDNLENKEVSNSSSHLPYWLQPYGLGNHHKDTMLELRKKWNRLCQSLHHGRHNQIHLYPSLPNPSLNGKNMYASSHPSWSTNLHYNQNNVVRELHSISFPESTLEPNGGNSKFTAQLNPGIGNWHDRDIPKQSISEVSSDSLKGPMKEVRTTLTLGNPLFSDSATSTDQRRGAVENAQELSWKLQQNIPWQSEIISSIVEALLDCRSGGTWLLIQGSDRIGKIRLAWVTAESLCGSLNRLVHINMRKLEYKVSSCCAILMEALRKNAKCVVLIEDIDHADANFINLLIKGLKSGILRDPSGIEVGLAHAIFILTTGSSTKFDEKPDNVMKMRLQVEEFDVSKDLKRKPEWDLPKESKKPRARENHLDLNMCADDHDDDEDAVPSDLTQEMDGRDLGIQHGLLESIEARFTLDNSQDRSHRMYESFLSKFNRSFKEAWSGEERRGCLSVDQMVVEELMVASGSFLDSLFEKWLREVFQTSLQTVKKGGKVRLCVEGKEGNVSECGFHGSTLPMRLHVDSSYVK